MTRKGWVARIAIGAACGWQLCAPSFGETPVIHPQKVPAIQLDAGLVIVESPPAPPKTSVTGFNGLCGRSPAIPAIPLSSALSGRSGEVAHEFVLGSFKAIKAYQFSLGGFRACLQRNVFDYKTALAEAKAQADAIRTAHVKWWSDELTAEYDRTIDQETAVVTAYMELHNAYCRMSDGLKGCPRPTAGN